MEDWADEERRDGLQVPENYASAYEAMDAIVRHGEVWLLTGFRHESSLNASAAARAIADGADTMLIYGDELIRLDDMTRYVSDSDAKDVISGVLRKWAETNWSTIVGQMHEQATIRFCKSYISFTDDSFRPLIKRWSQLRNDASLRDRLLRAMLKGECVPDDGVPRLRALSGDRDAATRVVVAIMDQNTRTAGREPFQKRDEFARLVAEWAGESVWGQLQYQLWRVDARIEDELPLPDPVPDNVIQVATLLKEFGILIVGEPGYELEKLSPETRASWRRELKTVIGDDTELREATTEALLWFGPKWCDRAVLFAVLELHEEELALHAFGAHPDPIVRRRTRAVIDMLRLEPDITELFTSRQRVARAGAPDPVGSIEPARTWIGDARIERLIKATLDEAAGSAATAIGKTLASGEETHVVVLFERLSAAFASITDRLTALARETHANERLSLKLEHRIVGKPEEGAAGVGTKRFSADICLLFEVRDKGRPFARRASLLQAKRLYRGKGSSAVDYYPFKTDQLEYLAAQTMAGFLLLLGPACEGVTMPVIPARLMLDLVERGEPASQIAPTQASRLGKGIGDWLVEDIIGLWTGDWNEKLIERAEGGPDREPYILVELIVERIHKGPDG